jgi:hypothetical protein
MRDEGFRREIEVYMLEEGVGEKGKESHHMLDCALSSRVSFISVMRL